MGNDLLASLRRLSDGALVSRIKDLATRERGTLVQLVVHLAELDTRDVHLREGHSSLFAYCRDVLALSEQEAYNRIAVARAIRRFPLVLEMLESGVLNLTTVRLLAPRLTAENHQAALEAARGKSKLQVEELAARLWPRPDVQSFVRKLPTKTCPVPPSFAVGTSLGAPAPVSPPPSPATTAPPGVLPAVVLPVVPPSEPPFHSPLISPPSTGAPAPSPVWLRPGPSAEVTPLAPDRYKVQVTISGETLEKLRRAKDLLRHAIPSGDEAAILDRALTALLAAIAQRKFAATAKPRPSGGTAPGSRHIPAEVKRAVWRRDRGQCAFVGTNHRRCPERGFLEFHHARPYAMGGEATVKNIQLRCRSHNGYEARVDFGHGSTTRSGTSPPVS